MWAALALDQELGEKAKPAVDRAQVFISTPRPRHSNEWFAARFLFANRFGEKEVAEKMIELLRRAQNEDGGWGWLNGMESDAIATGQSLYALSFAPKEKAEQLIARGRAFLQKTQREDGSWNVKGTLTEHKDQVLFTSVFWGTNWAVIGLCRTAEKT
jgi:prenyltransferase beta subunit